MGQNDQTIRRVSFFRARSPLSRPIADATHAIDTIAFVVTRLELAGGIVGESYLLSFDYSPRGIAGALRDAAGRAEGLHASDTGRFLAEHDREGEYFGQPGLHRWAQGAINVAMWDAWGKTLGQPVWKLLGVHRDRVPLYGSGGWLSYSIDELLAEVRGYVARGFGAVKVKVGSPEPERDVERLAKVREAVGPSIDVMMDANQGFDVPAALRLAREVQKLRISWFEEPIAHDDFDGYAHLRGHAGISLAMGEREFDTVPLRELLHRRGIDLWQPDLLRLGSVEAWRASAALAQAHRVPVLPHFYKEYDVPLLMTIPNARGAESFDWVDPIITRPIRMDGGFAHPTDAPGWGFAFKDQFLTPLEDA
jgi:L-alanine-DL-glutamate epimerase-like enolase superfamily enzyme